MYGALEKKTKVKSALLFLPCHYVTSPINDMWFHCTVNYKLTIQKTAFRDSLLAHKPRQTKTTKTSAGLVQEENDSACLRSFMC